MSTASSSRNELWALSAGEVAALVQARAVSAVEVAQAALGRIEQVNPKLNAIVESRPDEALARARAVDAALARGENPGPLAGVPVTIKVNTDQQGYATTNGVKLNRDLVAPANSPVVDSLLAAGAVPVGRTNTPAFSYRWFTSNLIHGATYNPHDKGLTPGGSSGGAGSAVAAGMGCIGHGTDIAGSIRYPAYACGVHGLRPSLGRVAAYNPSAARDRGIGPQLMAVSGPLARSVHDLRLGLNALARADARDPNWAPAPQIGPDAPRRAALCLRPDGLDTVPEICDALLDAAGKLRDAGWVVDELDALPPIAEAVRIQITLWLGDGYDALVKAAQAEGDPGAIAVLAGQAEVARSVGLDDFAQALARRLTLARAWGLFLQDYPVVLLPNSAELPFADNLDLDGADAYERVWLAQAPMIGLPVVGLPALSLCTGKAGSAPLGVQIAAGRFREDLCLAAAEAIEARGPAIRPVDPAW